MAGQRSPAEAGRRRDRRLLAAVCALALAAGAADHARASFGRWIAATELPPLAVAVGTEVVARDGSLLRAFPVENGRWRLAPPAEGVDARYLAMLLAWEDRRFRQHQGVDPRAVLRAAAQAAWHGRFVSGASTLSMQVARLLERGPTGGWRGKLRQARVAMALERRLGKDRVLDLYLRLAPYGGNVEGVRAASLMWFGKEPRRLTPAEAALLVALPQAPEARRPDRQAAREPARLARDRVLARAQAAGILTAEDAALARGVPLPRATLPFPALAPHLAERLRRETPGAARIATTIDPTLQRAAEALIGRATQRQTARLSASALIADHRTGEILAHVGAAHWTDEPSAGFIDMTRALRSPGSTLKPFVYALGFDAGLIHPETLIEDRAAAFGRWQPQNFDRRFRGTVTVRRALIESLNIPVVRVAEALGPAQIAVGLRRAGLRLQVQGGVPGLAMVLGGAGVSLEDLVAGYGSLARGGEALRLTARADEMASAGTRGAPLVGPVAAWYVTSILSQIAPPNGAQPGRIAWKTGTSYGHRDALAIGYDGALVAGVWLGRADGTPVPGAFGAELAGPVLFDLFDAAVSRARPLQAPPAHALMVATAQLPPALRRFSAPGDVPTPPAGPVAAEPMAIVFPPDGAVLAPRAAGVVAQLRGGEAPFTWLLDGRPIATAAMQRDLALGPLPAGFATLAVVDARGASQRVGFYSAR